VTEEAAATKTCPGCAEEVKGTAFVCTSCGFIFGQRAAAQLPRRQLDRLAILTFVLAVLWLFGIGSLLALCVGVLSLRRKREHQERRGRTVAWAGVALAVFGVGLAGLWIGLSVTA
jgi:hypothetical protein